MTGKENRELGRRLRARLQRGQLGRGTGSCGRPHTPCRPRATLHRQEGRKASAKEHQPQMCEEGRAWGPNPDRQLSRDNRCPRLEPARRLQGPLFWAWCVLGAVSEWVVKAVTMSELPAASRGTRRWAGLTRAQETPLCGPKSLLGSRGDGRESGDTEGPALSRAGRQAPDCLAVTASLEGETRDRGERGGVCGASSCSHLGFPAGPSPQAPQGLLGLEQAQAQEHRRWKRTEGQAGAGGRRGAPRGVHGTCAVSALTTWPGRGAGQPHWPQELPSHRRGTHCARPRSKPSAHGSSSLPRTVPRGGRVGTGPQDTPPLDLARSRAAGRRQHARSILALHSNFPSPTGPPRLARPGVRRGSERLCVGSPQTVPTVQGALSG